MDTKEFERRIRRLELLRPVKSLARTLDAALGPTGDAGRDAMRAYRAAIEEGSPPDPSAPQVITTLEASTALYRKLISLSTPGAQDERSNL